MRSQIKDTAFSILSRLQLPRIRHRIALQDRLSILMYHAVIRTPLPANDWCFLPEHSFRQQMSYLRKHFDVIPLSEATQRLRTGSIRRPTAAITFDDGFQNNYDVAFPILRKEGLPAAIFLTTGLVDTDDTIWFCRLHEAVMDSKEKTLEWQGKTLDLSTPRSRTKTSAALQDFLKNIPLPHFNERLAELFRALDYDPGRPIGAGSPFRILAKAAIKEMAESGLVEFGAHTRRHTILTGLSEEECAVDIRESVAAVSAMTGRPCRLFAYPYGRPRDYNRHALEALSKSGVHTAVVTMSGANDSRTPPLELKRYRIGADTTLARFQMLTHHFLAS